MVFATIVDYGLFCINNEPSRPIRTKTQSMCTTNNVKDKSIKNLIFTNLQWHFGSKKVKGKHTNRIIGKVTTKAICMLIQKPVKAPIIIHNNYDAVKTDELVDYGDYQQPWKLDSGVSGHYCGKNTGVRKQRTQQNGIKVQVADGKNMNQVEEGQAPFDGLPASARAFKYFNTCQMHLSVVEK